jgi:hypothetical protein
MIERSSPSRSSPTLESITSKVRARSLGSALAVSALGLLGCGSQGDDAPGQGGKKNEWEG